MNFKDITLEQAKQIAAINFNNIDFDSPEVEFSVKYQPYIHEWYEDARELITINFKCSGFGSFTYPVTIHIDSMLRCFIYYSKRSDDDTYTMLHTYGGIHPFPFVDLMRSFGIEPRPEFIPPYVYTPV